MKKGLYIYNQLQLIDGSLELVSLKTNSSKRKIIMIDYTIPILKEHKEKQLEAKKLLGKEYHDDGFIVSLPDGRPYTPDYITKNFRRVMDRISPELKIPKVRFHDLRHTHSTLLLLAEVNPKIVCERLGHSSVSMTLNTYSHVLPEMQQDAAIKFSDLFKDKTDGGQITVKPENPIE